MVAAVTEIGVQIDVKDHIILSNGWEYFVTERPDEDGIGMAYVEGLENEIGSFSINEIRPYIRSFVKDVSKDQDSPNYVMPPSGGRWL